MQFIDLGVPLVPCQEVLLVAQCTTLLLVFASSCIDAFSGSTHSLGSGSHLFLLTTPSCCALCVVVIDNLSRYCTVQGTCDWFLCYLSEIACSDAWSRHMPHLPLCACLAPCSHPSTSSSGCMLQLVPLADLPPASSNRLDC